jgi:putative transposase
MALCLALGLPRSSFYRHRRPKAASKPRPTPARALSADERQAVLGHLHSKRFIDRAPSEVWATLLTAGIHLCSIRSMYRILADNREVRERRNQLRHPHYTKPEIIARRPNEAWSWDITKLKGPAKWEYFYLYGDRSAKAGRQGSRDGGDYRGAPSILLILSGETAVERGSVHAELLGDLPS